MLAELKDKSQVTIPKTIVKELGLKRGDMFDVVVENGAVMFIPVVVYTKEKADELEALAASAKKSAAGGEAAIYDDVEGLIQDLHKAIQMSYKLQLEKNFIKHYQKLSADEQSMVDTKLRVLANNPQHPSLRTKRIQTTGEFEISVNMDIRIAITFNDDRIIVLISSGLISEME